MDAGKADEFMKSEKDAESLAGTLERAADLMGWPESSVYDLAWFTMGFDDPCDDNFTSEAARVGVSVARELRLPPAENDDDLDDIDFDDEDDDYPDYDYIYDDGSVKLDPQGDLPGIERI